MIRVYDAARQGNRDARAQGRFPRSRVARAALLPPDHKGRCRLWDIAFGIPGEIFEPSRCAHALLPAPAHPRPRDTDFSLLNPASPISVRRATGITAPRAGTEILLLGDFFSRFNRGHGALHRSPATFLSYGSNEFPRSGLDALTTNSSLARNPPFTATASPLFSFLYNTQPKLNQSHD